MYEYKDKDIVSLSLNFRDLVPSSDDITQDELKLITSDAFKENLSTDELDGLKKRFKKIHYTILDMEKNRKGFGVTEGGMKTFVDHFNATKEDKDLHNFFKDHDYGKIDSMLGRIVNTRYDEKNKRVRRTALIDLRHPTAQRLDMFQNLSTTLLHGKPVCSECNSQWLSCDHTESFPRSTVAYGIEDSLVTQSAYPNAKRDSLGMFKSSLSGIDIAEEYFTDELSLQVQEKAEQIKKEEEIKNAKTHEEKSRSAEQARQKETEKKKQEEKVELEEISKDIKFIKELIEKENFS